jgi:hypothetical protein
MYSTNHLQPLYIFFVQLYRVCVMHRTGNNLVRSRVAKLLWHSVSRQKCNLIKLIFSFIFIFFMSMYVIKLVHNASDVANGCCGGVDRVRDDVGVISGSRDTATAMFMHLFSFQGTCMQCIRFMIYFLCVWDPQSHLGLRGSPEGNFY